MTTNDNRPGFDRMIWAVLFVLGACFLAIMLAGCSVEKKMARDEAKAAAILAQAQIKAAKLCPWCIFQDSVTTKADSASLAMVYAGIDTADLRAGCAHLLDALRSENDILTHILANQVPDTVRVPVASLSPKARKAVDAIRSSVCQFDPLVYESDAVRVEVRPGATVPLLTVEEKERKLACPPCVAKVVYKDSPRVKSWGWLWAVLTFCLGFIVSSFIKGSHRHDP